MRRCEGLSLRELTLPFLNVENHLNSLHFLCYDWLGRPNVKVNSFPMINLLVGQVPCHGREHLSIKLS